MSLYTGQSPDFEEVDDGNSGAAKTIDFSLAPNHVITLTANTTLTLAMPSHDYRCQLRLVQDATGSRTVAYSGPTIRWVGGAIPTVNTGANTEHILTFFVKVSQAANRCYGVASLNFG